MLATIVIGAVLPAAMVRVELLTTVLAASHDGFLTAAVIACTVHGADAAATMVPRRRRVPVERAVGIRP